MNPEEINQALRLTIEELTRKLADEVTSKNLLAIQLTHKEEAYQVLLQKKEELEANLKEATTPLKIETMISKSGVSTATLALRAAKDVLNSFSGKNILIIGASGKIGDIVLKNALSYDFEQIYVTRRRHNIDMSPNVMDRISIIEYNDRYDYIKNADVIVSATSGPHFTLTKEHIQENIVPGSKKVFIDLAVPCDIDERVSILDNIYYYNMDDMKKFADENNEKKKISIEKANAMTDEGVEKFLKWALFQENLKVFSDATENLEKEMARIGEKKTLEHLFYKIRDNGSLEALQSIIDVLSI